LRKLLPKKPAASKPDFAMEPVGNKIESALQKKKKQFLAMSISEFGLSMESVDGLKKLFGEIGIGAESGNARKLLNYLELLQKWNARINLTASTEWQSLKPLFLEGISAAKLYPPGARDHLDIGSGAGFPGIILRILVPRIRLELVESRGKKSVFLETVIEALDLENSVVHTERLDALMSRCNPQRIWDCISWKGLKLRTYELMGLMQHANAHTQFWMFHGRELAAEDPEIVGKYLKLLDQKKCGKGKNWVLSIYSCQSPVADCQSQES
jgi:16S rRNA (guanine(527)-N(7))-methyltransferase RsmG